jgi:hypothetical protein
VGMGLRSERGTSRLIYWTVNVRLTLRVSPPLLAEATTVYFPAGVTGIVGFEPDPPSRGIARPPPHPVAAIKQLSSTKAASPVLRVLRKVKNPIGNKTANQNVFGRFIGGDNNDEDDTPVRTVTEIVVVFPSATLEGVTLQVEFLGNPVHVKFTVPEMFAAEPSNKGYTAFCPLAMVRLVPPFGFKVKSTPLPASVSV